MEKKKKSHLGSTLFVLILIVVVFGFVYPRYSFGYFIKSIRENDTASFSRDHDVKYNGKASYKITNEEYSDALFYQTVPVTPHTSYRVTCMVKTQDIENLGNTRTGGAQISIAGTSERSRNLYGTNDWTKLELLFNSKNRSEVDIAFRLGGFNDECKGMAYFSDFTMELGAQNYQNNWHFACFLFEELNATYGKNEGKEQSERALITERNREDVQDDMSRLQRTMKEISRGKMTMTYDILTIKEPIKTLTYDEENGYYIDAIDVVESIEPYLEKTEYDHLFFVSPFGEVNKKEETGLPLWVGLGGMDYLGIGYSNIRLTSAENDYTLRYDTRINTFPEEVFLHEFLHTLERNAKEYGYEEIPALHSYTQYGYEDKEFIGLYAWYQDYMNQEIKEENGTRIGLPKEVYISRPPHETDFILASEMIDSIRETDNIIEEILSIFERIKFVFNHIRHPEVNTITNAGEA